MGTKTSFWFSPTRKGLINLREAAQNKRASLIKGNHYSFWPGNEVSGQSNTQLRTHQTFVETPPSANLHAKPWVRAEAPGLSVSHSHSPTLPHFLLEAELILSLSWAPEWLLGVVWIDTLNSLSTSYKTLQGLVSQASFHVPGLLLQPNCPFRPSNAPCSFHLPLPADRSLYVSPWQTSQCVVPVLH